MPTWLLSSLSSSVEPSWRMAGMISWRVGAALALGVAVALLYRWSRRGEAVAPTFTPTLVLLAGLTAMVMQVIGDNSARAWSLVGALSVVRFRTAVKDSQDTAFVILAVIVGMASGASELAVALVGILVLALAAPLIWTPGRPEGWARAEGTLRLKVEGSEVVRAAVEGTFHASLRRYRLLAAATAKKGAALELTYAVRLRPGGSPLDLIAELNRIEGVSGVEIERAE